MKKITTLFFSFFFTVIVFAQDTRLNDSVIFVNNKPVALYSKTLSNSTLRYDMEVYSFTDYVLIKAEAIKFTAPVIQLKSFYYYELSFPPTADTFAIYIEDEAFPLVLAKIIADYNLISNNQLNKKAVTKFINNYYGGPALTAKIKSFENYLNDTRFFKDQVVRDRSKPVTLINDRIIMQDGVKVGYINNFQNLTVSNAPIYVNTTVSSYGQPDKQVTVVSEHRTYNTSETEITTANGRKVDPEVIKRGFSYPKKNDKEGFNLYEISKPVNDKTGRLYSEMLLMQICFLIEDYSL